VARLFAILGACALVLVGLFSIRIGDGLDSMVGAGQRDVPQSKTYTHPVADGFSLQSGAFPGVQLVGFDSCRIEKQTRGGFSFGAFNKLVFDRLSVCVPMDSDARIAAAHGGDHSSGFRTEDPCGLKEEFNRILSSYPRFSALEINGLSVAMEMPDGSAKPVLSARHVSAGMGGTLELTGAAFLSAGGTIIESDQASMSLAPPFLIRTDQGTHRLAPLVEERFLMLAQLRQ